MDAKGRAATNVDIGDRGASIARGWEAPASTIAAAGTSIATSTITITILTASINAIMEG